MASGYRIVLPNGAVQTLLVDESVDRNAVVDDLLRKWKPYCDGNWISGNIDDPFCGENRVKLFLDGLAYFLMVGNAEGIVTRYKDLAIGNTEIPVSSCPSSIECAMCGGNPTFADIQESDNAKFAMMIEKLDEKIPNPRKKNRVAHAPKKSGGGSRIKKINKIKKEHGLCRFVFATVDTENNFMLDGCVYHIDESVKQYNPKSTLEGMLYDMDKIVCVIDDSSRKLLFYDMNMDLICDELVTEVK